MWNWEILKNYGNNFYVLFIFLLFIVLYKWNFLLKIYIVYQHNNKYDIIPFVYDMNSIRIICQNVFPGKEYKEFQINNNAIQLYVQNTNHTIINSYQNNEI